MFSLCNKVMTIDMYLIMVVHWCTLYTVQHDIQYLDRLIHIVQFLRYF